jgi:hypothetical protein
VHPNNYGTEDWWYYIEFFTNTHVGLYIVFSDHTRVLVSGHCYSHSEEWETKLHKRLNDLPKVSNHTIEGTVWAQLCLALKYLVLCTEQSCPCLIPQCVLGIITLNQDLVNLSLFLTPYCSIRPLLSLSAKGQPSCFYSLWGRWGRNKSWANFYKADGTSWRKSVCVEAKK